MNKDELKQEIAKAIEDTPEKDVIKSVSLFGSFLHGTNTRDSDIDLLIDFDAHRSVGFFKLVRIQQQLEEKLGRKVDLVTKNSLSHFFRDKVLREAEKIYG